MTSSTIDRRKLLRNAVLGGTAGVAGVVGASALGPQGAEAAVAGPQIAPQDIDAGAPDPNFAEGLVRRIEDGMLHVTGSDSSLYRIRVTDGTSIWKLRPIGFDQVKTGDGLYARGVRLPDGALAAEALWINIVNLRGHIKNITRNAIKIDHNGKPIVGHVISGLSTAVYGDRPATGDLSKLRVGGAVQIIGAWRPATNEVDISTVYTPR